MSNTCKISGVSRNSQRNSFVLMTPLEAMTTAMPAWAPVGTKLMRRTRACSPSGVVASAMQSVSRDSVSAAPCRMLSGESALRESMSRMTSLPCSETGVRSITLST